MIAIQGELGSFSHEAAGQALGGGAAVRLLSCASFEALFRAVVQGDAGHGVVPIENSLAGSIHENYDHLRAAPLRIVGETQVRVRHCLIARPGMRLADVRRVASHPVALAQCRQFFAAHPALQAVAAADTAGSVRALRDGGLDADAAIASALAARLYGGAILAEGIEDHAANFTRFLVVARAAAGDPPPAPSKLSLTFTTANAPGALYRALGAFADRGLNLTKIESRPLPGRPWDYVFYLDVEGEPRERVEPALKALHALAGDVRVLGWYGAAAVPAPG